MIENIPGGCSGVDRFTRLKAHLRKPNIYVGVNLHENLTQHCIFNKGLLYKNKNQSSGCVAIDPQYGFLVRHILSHIS